MPKARLQPSLAYLMAEQELSDNVVELAHLFGFRVSLVRPARTAHGWRTPMGADGNGWPDLTLVKGDRLIFAELKSAKGRLTLEQVNWLEALGVPAESYVWRPTDWTEGTIEAVLRRKP